MSGILTLSENFWKQRKSETSFDLDVDYQRFKARGSLNAEQRLVYDTVMGHLLTQDRSQDRCQLFLHVHGDGGAGKSYLINLLACCTHGCCAGIRYQAPLCCFSASPSHQQSFGRSPPSTCLLFYKASSYNKEVQGVEAQGRNAYMRFDKTVCRRSWRSSCRCLAVYERPVNEYNHLPL